LKPIYLSLGASFPSFTWHPIFFFAPFLLSLQGLRFIRYKYRHARRAQFKDSGGRARGLLEGIEKSLVRRLMKSSGKQPFLIVLLILFLSMNKKERKERTRKGRKLLARHWRPVTEYLSFHPAPSPKI
jgi:hypothetical protein